MYSEVTSEGQATAGRIAHVSDLHFGRTDRVVSEGLLADVRDQAPELVVISGDLTMRARNREYQEAVSFIDRLPCRCLCVPGNHDIPHKNLVKRFWSPFRRYMRYIGDDLMPRLETERYAIIGFNTTRSFDFRSLDWSRGRINLKQLAAARAFFDDVPKEKPRIVFGHHPFILPADDPSRGLVGRVTQALTSFGLSEVDLLLAGHLHQAFWRTLSVGEAEDADREHTLLALQASTATSDRLRGEANAYNIIDVSSQGFEICKRDWTDGRFQTAERITHELHRGVLA